MNETLRFERKFVITSPVVPVEKLIRANPFQFKEAYPARHVNNIYLDSPLFRNFSESTSGNTRRRKVRIRWYGEMFGEINGCALEIKEKTGLISEKSVYPLPPFAFLKGISRKTIKGLLKNADLPEEVHVLIDALSPVLVNRYRRVYYLSRDNRFRLTLDSDMAFGVFKKYQNTFLLNRNDHTTRIMELKYAPEDDDLLSGITQFLPFRYDRFSKYVTGIGMIYSHLSALTY